jgi:hypothetical protein
VVAGGTLWLNPTSAALIGGIPPAPEFVVRELSLVVVARGTLDAASAPENATRQSLAYLHLRENALSRR